MTKKSSSKSTKSQSAGGARTLIGTILAAIVLIIALVLTNVTGIDFLGLIGAEPTRTPAATITPIPPTEIASVPSGNVRQITNIPLGVGAEKGFWQVFFTAPTGSRDASTYVGGIDTQLAAAINGTQRTLDIAAFEFNNEVLTQAILDAKRRGVNVRVVTDNQHGTQDTADTSLARFVAAGIPVVDDGRSALMHNKFMILDSSVVWTGSWNYTVNDTYRNNNNALSLRSRRVVENYQAEFNEMFEEKQFGPRSPRNTPHPSFVQDGVPIQIYFSPEDDVLPALINTVNSARTSVRFMTFSFTDADVGTALIERFRAGVSVQGIFERTGSETAFAQLRPLYCAGVDARQDGNPFVLHHKVFIVDNATVVTGSFNISANATRNNDENLLIITDPDLAAQYTAEFERRWGEAAPPAADRMGCQ